MSLCWVIGKRARIESNGHEYIAEPFIVFQTEAEADAACDMVQKVSGERPMKVEAGFNGAGP